MCISKSGVLSWIAAVSTTTLLWGALLTVPAQAQMGKKCRGNDVVPINAVSWIEAELLRGQPNTPILRIMQIGLGPAKDVVGGKITNARPGDRVWIDSSKDGGRTWFQCGPVAVRKGFHFQETRLAYYPIEGHWARVCGDREVKKGVRKHNCTIWYREVNDNLQKCEKAPCPK